MAGMLAHRNSINPAGERREEGKEVGSPGGGRGRWAIGQAWALAFGRF